MISCEDVWNEFRQTWIYVFKERRFSGKLRVRVRVREDGQFLEHDATAHISSWKCGKGAVK